MGSFHYISEIVESKEEQGPRQGRNVEHHGTRLLKTDGKGGKSVLKAGPNATHEDDLNKLFAAINFKISAEGLSPRYIGPDALRKLKKPMAAASPPPSTLGTSEPVTLKQALRGLCISQASEMAAMKRISKPNSPHFSDTSKLKSFCKSAKVEPGYPHSDSEDRKGGIPFPSRDRIPIPQAPKTVTTSPLSISHNGSPRIASAPALDIRAKSLWNIKPALKQDVMPKNESGPSISANIRGKDLPAKAAKKGKILTSESIATVSVANGKKASKGSRYMMKLVPPNKGIPKKKTKQQQDLSSQPDTGDRNEEPDITPDANPMVCQRCRCTLSSSNSGNLGSDFKAEESVGTNDESRRNRSEKPSEKCELSQSSQSSLGEYSSCTSVSGESSLSRPSCSNRPHMSKDVRWKAIRQVRSKYRVLGLENFSLIKKLGCGDIGTVYLAELIGSNCLFAIKVMDIEYLERRKKTNRAETERMILKILDHPFLPTLYAHFTSDNLSCLVMEYCPGGDLHVLRQKQPDRNFSENAARFYAAEVLLALEYLHMMGVVYRDLKPENILVREDGHIMLTDFDLSLRCTVSPTLLLKSPPLSLLRVGPPASSCIDPFCSDPSFRVPSCFSPRLGRRAGSRPGSAGRVLPQLVAEPTDARSNSFVGTHEYLAPEIIKGEGHGSAVDWWTFGIFLYELLYGRTPFKGQGNEETLGRVVSYGLRFPDSPAVGGLARGLITGLLVKDPGRRLGSERGAAEIKRHPFFEGLNWALVRCAVPPEIPDPDPDPDRDGGGSVGGKLEEEAAAGEGKHGGLEIDVF